MSGTIQASIVKDSASSTSNLALDSSGNVTVGNNLTVSGTGNQSFGGNVGIGTSSPTAPVSINNAAGPAASGNMNTGLYVGGAGSYSINIGGNASGQYAWINAAFQNNSGVAAPLVLMTGATERMRIDSSGNLLVGTTSQVWDEKLSVYRTSNNVVVGGYSSSNSYTTSVIRAQVETTASTSWKLFDGRAAGGFNQIAIYGNGNIQNTNNSYGAFSDISLKENIVDATPKLADLLKVKIRNYNLKVDETKTKQIGVVAQELETVFPSMIEEDGNGIKGVKYSVFVPILVKALQEAVAKIDALETRIAKLESK